MTRARNPLRWAPIVLASVAIARADAPQIWRQPKDRVAAPQETVTFLVDAIGPLPLSYQWRKNGTDVSGATQREFTIIDVQAADEADYDVVVSNVDGSVISNTATLARTTTPQTQRVNLTSDELQADQDSSVPSIDDAGRYVAFQSTADSLLAGPGDNFMHVFLRDRQSARMTQLDAAPGEGRTDADSLAPVMSTDERWIAFESDASNLTPGDTNALRDVFLMDQINRTTLRISVGAGGAQANGASREPAIATQASRVAFTSDASNLVPGDTNAAADVFVYERTTGTIQRVSVDSGGGESNGASQSPAISDDGRYVVFSSVATSLVAGDTNGVADVFVHDLQSGTTVRISVDSSGNEGDGESLRPCISADGTWIGFESDATNLIASDTNGQRDVFAHELATGQTRRISHGPAAAEGDGPSTQITLSRDGSYAAFLSEATNLVPADANGVRDVFWIDRDPTGNGVLDEGDDEPLRASLADGSGNEANAASSWAQIGSNGVRVVFESDASNLVDSDTNAAADVFTREIAFNFTARLSVTSAGGQANGASLRPTISGNSQYVVFASVADSLSAGDRNGAFDIFTRNIQVNQTELRSRAWRANGDSIAPKLSADGRFAVFQTYGDIFPNHGPFAEIVLRDLQTDAFEAISTNSSGVAANSNSFSPQISADGRYVAFNSSATNLVTGVSGLQIYVKDRQTGAVELISANTSGQPAATQGDVHAISADGRFVVFASVGADFVAGDTNGRRDIFVRDRQTLTTIRASLSNTGEQSNRDCTSPAISADAQLVAFETAATNFSASDTNAQTDIYLRDLAAGTTTLISATPAGAAGNDGSGHPAFSSDGLMLYFQSNATNLIPVDGSPRVDVYVRDLAGGLTKLVSVDSAGQQALGGDSFQPAASGDGRYVAFSSLATNLVADDNNGRCDIFVHDSEGCLPPSIFVEPLDQARYVGEITTFFVAASGTTPFTFQWRFNGTDISGANSDTYVISSTDLSHAGQYDVVIANDCGDAFSAVANLTVQDCAPTTELGSTGVGGIPVEASGIAVSDDGRHLVFASRAGTLLPSVTGTGSFDWHVYAFDRQSNVVTCMSVRPDGSPADSTHDTAEVSGDGRFVLFHSSSNQLVSGPTSLERHVFRRDRDPDQNGVLDEGNGVTVRVSASSAGTAGNLSSGGFMRQSISADGRYVAFVSAATNLTGGTSSPFEQVFLRDMQTGTVTRVTEVSGTPGNGSSQSVRISRNGRYVTFASAASNLVTGDTNSRVDAFLYDSQTGQLTRVSVSSAGVEGNGVSDQPSASDDGRYVAFQSDASNLVAGDTNANTDVFIRDLLAGQTTRVSFGPSAAQGNDASFYPRISGDGQFVAYYSLASNLIASDTNSAADTFVYDSQAGSSTRVSVATGGTQGNALSGSFSENVSISSDGRYVGFMSRARNLGIALGTEAPRLYLRDTQLPETLHASVSGSGVPAGGLCERAALDYAGRFVAFASVAGNLDARDTNSGADIFVLDRVTGEIQLADTNAAGVLPSGFFTSQSPAISGDGAYVAFASNSSGLVSGDTNGVADVFVKSLDTGAITLISRTPGGAPGNAASGTWSNRDIALSYDGRFVAFSSAATDLVSGDTSFVDIFVHDRDPDANGVFDENNGVVTRISVDALGNPANDDSNSPRISADGRYVAFRSEAFNLHPQATPGVLIFRRDRATNTIELISRAPNNSVFSNASEPSITADGERVAFVQFNNPDPRQVYVRDVPSATTTLVSTTTGGVAGNNTSDTPAISPDGAFIAFGSAATNLVPGDTNARSDVFLRNLGANTIERVNVGPSGVQANNHAQSPAIADDGAVVAFSNLATNLIPGITPSVQQIGIRNRETCSPAGVIGNPGDQSTPPGGHVTFTVAAVGVPRPTYQWYRDGNPLPGATFRQLTILNAGPSEEGNYTVVVENPLGSDVSQPAALTLILPCPGDVNGDQIVDIADLSLLLSHFGTLNGATLADGDLDDDGDVDLSDLTLLLSRFGLPC